jgi:hypothetical protein
MSKTKQSAKKKVKQEEETIPDGVDDTSSDVTGSDASSDSDASDASSDSDSSSDASDATSGSDEDTSSSSDDETHSDQSGVDLTTADPLKYLFFNPANTIKPIAKKISKQTKIKKIGAITPYPIQNVVGKTLASLTGTCQFKAPTGFGKTFTSVITALESTRCIINIPPGIYAVWLNDLKKCGMYDKDPKQSRVLSYSDNKDHVDYLDNIFDNPKKYKDTNKQLIVLCKRLSLERTVALFKKIGYSDNSTVIIDEAHKDNKSVVEFLVPLVKKKIVSRYILMSGTELNLKDIGFKDNDLKIDSFIWTYVTGKLPTDVWHYKYMNSRYYADDPDEWKEKISHIAAKYKKVVLVGTKEVTEDVFGKVEGVRVESEYEGKTIVRFKSSSTTSQEKFNAVGKKTIASLDYTKTVGLNLLGNCMIVINPGKMTNNVLTQLAARLLRPNNKNKTVHYYMLCGDNSEFLKSYYAWAFYNHAWQFGNDPDVNAGMVHKGVAMIKALGKSPIEINRNDACVILADYAKLTTTIQTGTTIQLEANPFSQIYAWWKENKTDDTVLDKDLISNIAW